MATDLVGNVELQRFIQLLADLNHQTVSALKTGDMRDLQKMNDTVEEMYAIQHSKTEEAYTAIDEYMQIIYNNFNAMVLMIKSNEKTLADAATNTAVKKFLHNIFQATVNIIYAYGLA